ncbi:hypothetical protein ACO0RG_000279 [Hanseniaspora osmophila]|uniref:Mitochondrial protein import protein ZIM17 n=1 Tax=Hanseniaspora osmophila TaxID=56408 RepID=A0A1E5R526_9ASCO|nr:Mitochondrial protein import protein ZIM17 [Hanseniaspora osmophila]
MLKNAIKYNKCNPLRLQLKPAIRPSSNTSSLTACAIGTTHRSYHKTSQLLQNSTGKKPAPTSRSQQQKQDKGTPIGQLKVDKPMMMIAFTCKKCGTRSGHQMSKQAYTKGSVLVQCPGCKNRHLIADHLNIFQDKKTHLDIEELMKLQNESVSTNVEDLCFEDIPEKLKTQIGHLAKDAPEHLKKNLRDTMNVHSLPHSKSDGEKN